MHRINLCFDSSLSNASSSASRRAFSFRLQFFFAWSFQQRLILPPSTSSVQTVVGCQAVVAIGSSYSQNFRSSSELVRGFCMFSYCIVCYSGRHARFCELFTYLNNREAVALGGMSGSYTSPLFASIFSLALSSRSCSQSGIKFL